MKLTYRPDIDGLRAFAVIAVFMYHLNHSWLHGGFLGVDIFFVISGYLITKIIYTDIINNRFTFKSFYQRRINRILPVFFFVMFVTFVLSIFILLPHEFNFFIKTIRSTLYIGQNIYFARNTGGYWDSAAEEMPLLHTWSLAVEEQFYIIFPILLVILYRLKFKQKSILATLVLVAFISFLLAQFSPYSAFLTKYNYYSLFTARAGELLIGSIIGILSLKEHKTNLRVANILTIIGFIGMALSFIFISEKILYPSFYALFPTVSVALIIFYGNSNVYISRFLSFKPFIFIGKISYSMYLWHWVIIVLVKKYYFIDEFTAFQYIAIITSTILLSFLSYRLIETPARRNKRSFAKSLIYFYIIPATIVLGVYYYNKSYNILKTTDRELKLVYIDKNNNFCNGKIIGNCTFGDTTKEPKILMIGDSHAGHYSPYLDEIGKHYGFATTIIFSAGCNFISKKAKINIQEEVEKCENLTKYINSIIDKYDIVIYAIRWDLHLKDDFFIEQLKSYIGSYLQNKKIIFFKQIPSAEKIELRRSMRNYLHKGKFLEIKTKNYNSIESLFDNVIHHDPLKCLDNLISYDNIPIYYDDNHLNEYATRLWTKEVIQKQDDFWTDIIKHISK